MTAPARSVESEAVKAACAGQLGSGSGLGLGLGLEFGLGFGLGIGSGLGFVSRMAWKISG